MLAYQVFLPNEPSPQIPIFLFYSFNVHESVLMSCLSFDYGLLRQGLNYVGLSGLELTGYSRADWL